MVKCDPTCASIGTERDNNEGLVQDRKISFKWSKLSKKKKNGIKITGIGLTAILILSYGNYKLGYDYTPDLSDKSIVQTLSDRENETCLDELLEMKQYNGTALAVEELENSLVLGMQLSELNLDKYNKELKTVDVSMLTAADIALLIENYNTSKDKVELKTPTPSTEEFYDVVARLSSYKKKLDSELYLDSVQSINNYTTALLYSISLDSLGRVPEDVTHISCNLLDLTAKDFTIHYEFESGVSFDLQISSFSNLNKLVEEVRTLNRMEQSVNLSEHPAEISADEFQKQIEKIINRIKLAQQFEYPIDKDVIEQEGNNLTKKLVF